MTSTGIQKVSAVGARHVRRWPLFGGILLLALVTLGVAGVLFSVSDRSQPLAETSPGNGGGGTTGSTSDQTVGVWQADPWSVSIGPGYNASEFASLIPSLRWTPQPRLDLWSPAFGKVVATINTGPNPLIARRPSAGEIIVSDFTPNGGPRRLRILDAATGLQTRDELLLDARFQYASYAENLMVLSRDEKYLYLMDIGRAVGSQCGPSACDVLAILIVQLDDLAAEVQAVEVPRGCAIARLTPTGSDAVTVSCQSFPHVSVLDPTGAVLQTDDFEATFGGFVQASGDRWYLSGFVAKDGELGVLTNDGSALVRRVDGGLSEFRLAPENTELRSEGAVRTDAAGNLLVPFTRDRFSGTVDGYIRFDPIELEVRDVIELGTARSYAPLTDSESFVGESVTGEVRIFDRVGRLQHAYHRSHDVDAGLPAGSSVEWVVLP